MRRRIVCFCAFLWMTTVPSEAVTPLRVRVSPMYAIAPATLRVQVVVDRSAVNGAVEVVADSADYYRSSQVQIDGDRGPSTVHVEFRDVPSGRYSVLVVLKDSSDRPRAFARREVDVLSFMPK